MVPGPAYQHQGGPPRGGGGWGPPPGYGPAYGRFPPRGFHHGPPHPHPPHPHPHGPHARGRGGGPPGRPQTGTGGKQLKFDGDYDFEAANEKFEEEIKDIKEGTEKLKIGTPPDE